MSDKIMQGVFTEIAHDNELRSVHVEWNGGEPLLEMELIRKFSSSLVVFCQQKGITYSASVLLLRLMIAIKRSRCFKCYID